MNVNPLNTIPGQNTATRGSESGQIRYRMLACERLPHHDPVGCRSLILSLTLLRVQCRAFGDLLCERALNLSRTPHRKECLVRGRPNELLIVEPMRRDVPKTRDTASSRALAYPNYVTLTFSLFFFFSALWFLTREPIDSKSYEILRTRGGYIGMYYACKFTLRRSKITTPLKIRLFSDFAL